jgi:ABC-type enterochelin transport system ATPase subunit
VDEIIEAQTLGEIYHSPFKVHDLNGQRIATFY